ETARARPGKTPLFGDFAAPAHMNGDLAQHPFLRLGQHQLVPARRRRDALRQLVELRARLRPAGFPERVGEGLRLGLVLRAGANRADRAGIEVELSAEQLEFAVEARRPSELTSTTPRSSSTMRATAFSLAASLPSAS